VKKANALRAGVGLLAAAAAALLLHLHAGDAPTPGATALPAARSPLREAAPARSMTPAAATVAPLTVPSMTDPDPVETGREPDLDALAYRGSGDFRDRLRALVQDPPAAAGGARDRAVAALAQDVQRLENGGLLLPAQALWLRVALLRVALADRPDAFTRQADALMQAYLAHVRAQTQAARQRLVRENAGYRRAELDVVQQTLREPFADETTRQRVLRQRLLQLRGRMYDLRDADGAR
jgi:hypothetical protein